MLHKFLAATAGTLALGAAGAIPITNAHADSFRNDQWHLRSLRVSAAHAISTGDGITVGLIDTGAYPHPDLRKNLLEGVDLVPGESGTGRSDRAGHGTNMAALIAGHGRGSGDGVIGIAPAARILPVKISNKNSSAPAAEMAKGIEWAANHGAKIINVSAGAGPAFELQSAVTSAIQRDIVFVAGVGNTGQQAIIAYPAAIDGVLVVGAIGRNGRHASLSIKDPRVQICAPGIGITTAQPRDKYVDVDGTSAATALVSGAAALVREKFKELSAREVINRLTATADDIGPPGRDDECGYGVLNIVKALTANVPPLESATTSPPPQTTATATPSASPSRNTSTNTAEPPDPASSSGSTLAIIGGLMGAIAAGATVALVALRRRRAP